MILRFGVKAVDLKQKIPEISQISLKNLIASFNEGSIQLEGDLDFEKLFAKTKNALYKALLLDQEPIKEY